MRLNKRPYSEVAPEIVVMFIAFARSGQLRGYIPAMIDLIDRFYQLGHQESAHFWLPTMKGKLGQTRTWNKKSAVLSAAFLQEGRTDSILLWTEPGQNELDLALKEDANPHPDVFAFCIFEQQLLPIGLPSITNLYEAMVEALPVSYGFAHPIKRCELDTMRRMQFGTSIDRPQIAEDSRVWSVGGWEGGFERLIRGWYWGNLLSPRHMELLGSLDPLREQVPDLRVIPFPRGMTFLTMGDEPMMGITPEFWSKRDQLTEFYYPIMMKSIHDKSDREWQEKGLPDLLGRIRGGVREDLEGDQVKISDKFVKTIQECLGDLHLDGSVESLRRLDDILDEYYCREKRKGNAICVQDGLSALLALLMRHEFGGQWSMSSEPDKPSIYIEGKEIFPTSLARKRLNESGFTLQSLFNAIKGTIGRKTGNG